MGYTEKLIAGQYYHIYNRGINGENIFREEKNYNYFFRLTQKYLMPISQLYAYCFLQNHFHLLVKIHNEPDHVKADKLHLPFSHLFNAYTRAYNKMYGRTGSLFERPFKRIMVKDHRYLIQLVQYIHKNPEKHGFVKDFREWPYSSYPTVLEQKASLLQAADLISWFDGIDEFKAYHEMREPQDLLDFDR